MEEVFYFKQFAVRQDGVGMKVGTDGVLLGAWVRAPHAGRVLDVGTGTGLLALMVAQRSKALVWGIDVEPVCTSRAVENARRSRWGDRLHFVCGDFMDYNPCVCFNMIVSNPPFFTSGKGCASWERRVAREGVSLPLGGLIEHGCVLLVDGGVLCVVLPVERVDEAVCAGWECGLSVARECYVATRAGGRVRRVLLEFVRGESDEVVRERLDIYDANGGYSEAYVSLTRPYYLYF